MSTLKSHIHIKKLTDSPYSSGLKDAFHFENEPYLQETVRELCHANPSCYLISGYRGVGKTSFINRIGEALPKGTLFVTVGVSKYEGYPNLIKKLIRKLFHSYSAISTPSLHELNTRFDMLYQRTFHTVVSSEKAQNGNETTYRTELVADLKAFIPGLVTALLVLSLRLGLFNLPYVNDLLVLASFAWTFITTWKFTVGYQQTSKKTAELSKTTLYDDEIAEHHLFNILSDLKSAEIKTVITFDELDKMKPEDVEILLNDFKPLLLSGTANFLVVGGQKLFYQFEKAQVNDDPVMASLFSKTIHISFPSHLALRQHCINMLGNPDKAKEEQVYQFFDSIIMDSGRVPRKLSNTIKQHLIWEDDDGVAYLEIPPIAEHLSRTINTVTKLLDNDLQAITSIPAKRDFFIAQILIWIKRIRSHPFITWSADDIIQRDQYGTDEYPSKYIAQLDPLWELLTDRLIEDKIIKKKVIDGITVYESEHEAQQNYIPKSISSFEFSNDITGKFISQFIQLEQYIKHVYVHLISGATLENTKLPINQMLNKLIEIGTLSTTWRDSERTGKLINARNKIAHGEALTEDEAKFIEGSEFDINRLRSELITDYAISVTKKVLAGFKVNRPEGLADMGYDMIAKNKHRTILFQIKQAAGLQTNRNEITTTIKTFLKYNRHSEKNSYYCLLYYYEGAIDISEIRDIYHSILENDFKIKMDHLFILPYAIITSTIPSLQLEKNLDGMLTEILSREIQNESAPPI